MNAACERGEAVPLARTLSWLMRWRDAWWVIFEHGWLRIVDELIEPDLHRISARLTAAEAAASESVAADSGGPSRAEECEETEG